MSSSRFFKAFAVGVFIASISLASPAAQAVQRVDDPRDTIVRFVKYLKKIFTISALDEQPGPPHP
jgi:hypothetical protein